MANEPVFAIPPNGRDQVVETSAYLTSVLTGYAGLEQRSPLRARPQLSLEYSLGALYGDQARAFAALLEGGGASRYLVPLWQYARSLTAPASLGAWALAADLAGLPRLPQGTGYRFVLYSPGGSEDVPASAWTDTTVTLVGTLGRAWPAGSTILPALVGALSGAPARERRGPLGLAGSVAFDLDLLGTAYAAGTHAGSFHAAAAYLGLDVFTDTLYGGSPPGEIYSRRVATFGGQAGKRSLEAQEAAAGWTRTLLLKCSGVDRIEALRAFLDARQGRALAFWLPSWDEDLLLAAGADEGATEIQIACPEGTGYDVLLWPLGACRRYLQVWTWGSAPSYHHVTAIGTAEDRVLPLTITPALPAAATTDTRLSYLRCCRLDTDAPRLAWRGTTYADCELPVREIPTEYPA